MTMRFNLYGLIALLAVVLLSLADENRHLGETRKARGTETPLSGDKLIFGEKTAVVAHHLSSGYHKGLEDTVLADRVGKTL